MWYGVPFARQWRPVVGVLRLCWLLPGLFDCCCCPRASVHRPSITCLSVFLCAPPPLPTHVHSPVIGRACGTPHVRRSSLPAHHIASHPLPTPPHPPRPFHARHSRPPKLSVIPPPAACLIPDTLKAFVWQSPTPPMTL